LTGGTVRRDPNQEDADSRPVRFFRAASAASLGLEMGIAVAIGAGIGYLLDHRFGTRPWLMLVFLLFGIAAGFKGMFAAARRATSTGATSNQTKADGTQRARQD